MLMSDDTFGFWRWSIIHCLSVFRNSKSQLMGRKLVVVVVVVVMVVGVVVKVALMSDDKLGSWSWSIIHCLRVFWRKKNAGQMDQPTGRPTDGQYLSYRCVGASENNIKARLRIWRVTVQYIQFFL